MTCADWSAMATSNSSSSALKASCCFESTFSTPINAPSTSSGTASSLRMSLRTET